MRKFLILFLIFSFKLHCQNINVNGDYIYENLKNSILDGRLKTSYSFNIRPVNSNHIYNYKKFKTLYENKKQTIQVKSLGIDYFLEFNSNHPYNRNNGTMIPNRGYQHIISTGIYTKIGPLTIKFMPEHHFAENKNFDTFWEGHYPEIWSKRYRLWNHIDLPERFGEKLHNKTTFGQSSIKLNWKNLSFGISTENIWWGPSFRNSIMMSNHAQGFNHITFNTNKPINTVIGKFEWQFITGRLENSGFLPTNSEIMYAGTKLYVPRINQIWETNDWRFLQGYIISYSPKYIEGLSFGIIRWTQMYSALIEGKYHWLDVKKNYLPVFTYLFRNKNKNVDFEMQTNEAAGLFFNWQWLDSKAEFYAEFHYNDSKINLRDLILDSEHSKASTLGLRKIFEIKNTPILFSWEWTQMEQNASRLVRNANSWYEHYYVLDGYTHKGEVLGSSIGPGSNSQYFSLSKIDENENIGLAFEIIDQDNDFYHEAFADARDFRRYWKDLNFHINYSKFYKNFSISTNLIFIKSLNYQWELDDFAEPYYHAGNDVNNFHFNIKLSYFGFNNFIK